jgi:hypothetical protein
MRRLELIGPADASHRAACCVLTGEVHGDERAAVLAWSDDRGHEGQRARRAMVRLVPAWTEANARSDDGRPPWGGGDRGGDGHERPDGWALGPPRGRIECTPATPRPPGSSHVPRGSLDVAWGVLVVYWVSCLT